MYSIMKKQNFGVEIELTGITRSRAAQVIADYRPDHFKVGGVF